MLPSGHDRTRSRIRRIPIKYTYIHIVYLSTWSRVAREHHRIAPDSAKIKCCSWTHTMCRNVVLFPKISRPSCESCEKIEITIRDSGRFARVGSEYKSDKNSRAGECIYMRVCVCVYAREIVQEYSGNLCGERVGRANSLAR